MSLGIASPSTVRNANRSQKATVLDSQNRWSGRTGSRAIVASTRVRPMPRACRSGSTATDASSRVPDPWTRTWAHATTVPSSSATRNRRQSRSRGLRWASWTRSWIALASASVAARMTGPVDRSTPRPDAAHGADASTGLGILDGCRSRSTAASATSRRRRSPRPASRPAPRRPCWPVVGSSSSSIARRACTTTSGWRSTACSPRGPSRRARPSTRRSGGWPSTSRTTRWSTSTSRA